MKLKNAKTGKIETVAGKKRDITFSQTRYNHTKGVMQYLDTDGRWKTCKLGGKK